MNAKMTPESLKALFGVEITIQNKKFTYRGRVQSLALIGTTLMVILSSLCVRAAGTERMQLSGIKCYMRSPFAIVARGSAMKVMHTLSFNRTRAT